MTYWPRLAAGGETRNAHGNFAFALIAPLLPSILFRYVGRMRRSVVSLSLSWTYAGAGPIPRAQVPQLY